MKRLLPLTILVSALLVSPIFASSPDISSLSDEDLLDLRSKVEDEISIRGIGSSVIEEGVYVVGKDIKEGTYVFTGLVNNDYDNEVLATTVFYWPTEQDYNDGNDDSVQEIGLGNQCRLSVADGGVVRIKYHLCEVKEADALPFAP